MNVAAEDRASRADRDSVFKVAILEAPMEPARAMPFAAAVDSIISGTVAGE